MIALRGIKSDVSPIHWQYGAIARLEKGETIDKLLEGGYSLPLVIVVDDNLSVIAAYVAVVALGIELGILYILIDILDYLAHSLEIMRHVGYLHVGNTSAAGYHDGRVADYA